MDCHAGDEAGRLVARHGALPRRADRQKSPVRAKIAREVHPFDVDKVHHSLHDGPGQRGEYRRNASGDKQAQRASQLAKAELK